MKPDREPDGEWPTFNQWVQFATRDIGGMNAACYDAKGRRCYIGRDFMLADKEGTFPVSYWYGEGGETPEQQRDSKKRAEATLKANYPWRFK
jgi:hypothetical protein